MLWKGCSICGHCAIATDYFPLHSRDCNRVHSSVKVLWKERSICDIRAIATECFPPISFRESVNPWIQCWEVRFDLWPPRYYNGLGFRCIRAVFFPWTRDSVKVQGVHPRCCYGLLSVAFARLQQSSFRESVKVLRKGCMTFALLQRIAFRCTRDCNKVHSVNPWILESAGKGVQSETFALLWRIAFRCIRVIATEFFPWIRESVKVLGKGRSICDAISTDYFPLHSHDCNRVHSVNPWKCSRKGVQSVTFALLQRIAFRCIRVTATQFIPRIRERPWHKLFNLWHSHYCNGLLCVRIGDCNRCANPWKCWIFICDIHVPAKDCVPLRSLDCNRVHSVQSREYRAILRKHVVVYEISHFRPCWYKSQDLVPNGFCQSKSTAIQLDRVQKGRRQSLSVWSEELRDFNFPS
jgi:hypothetical protein